VVGHLDILKKFSRFAVPRRNPLDPAEAVLLLIRDRDLALEVNTGGFFRASDGTPYPSLPFLKRAAELGVDVVFGSDAHTPSDVGRGFGEAMALMRSLGWRNAATFRAGRKQVVPLAA
jgi:histidinol-phosphatase (PHP family)